MITFKITGCEKYKDYNDIIFYNEFDVYDYIRIDDNGKETTGMASISSIQRNQTLLDLMESDAFDDAVRNYVVEWNKKINEDKKQEVKFEILNKHDDSQYEYKMYRGGKVYKEGVASYGYWEKLDEGKSWHDQTLSAWNEAVKDYMGKNDIKSPSSKIKEKIEKIKEKIPHGDDNIPDFVPMIAPTIPTAIAEITSEPCKCINDLMTACKKGPVNPLDLLMYTKEATKTNVRIAKDKLVNGMATILGVVTTPVLNQLDQCVDYFAEIDSAQEEFRKKLSDPLNAYKVCMDETEPSEVEGLEEATSTSEETSDENVVPAVSETKITNEAVKNATTAPEVLTQVLANSSNTSIPLKYQELADKAFNARNTGGKIPDSILSRYQKYYNEIFKSLFTQYNVPLPMTVMSIIESNANPLINNGEENYVTAKGMWQFTRTTGWEWKLLELEPINGKYPNETSASNRDWYVVPNTDYRSDVAKSSAAAAKYIKSLRKYSFITNWLLAAGAYNCGPGNIKKYIKNAGGEGADFWTIFENIQPLETRNYILLIIKYSQLLGFNTDNLFR